MIAVDDRTTVAAILRHVALKEIQVEEESLLRGIEANPEDEAVRQVYADWLEERSDPRAEFLRLEALLRSAPHSDPRRQQLGRRWRELRASLDRSWVVRVGGHAAVPPWALRAVGKPARLGVLDYYEWMSHNHWEWVILAVLAPLDAVVCALVDSRKRASSADFLSSSRWFRDVPIRTGAEGDTVSSLTPLMQLCGHAWTIALYDTFNLTLPWYYSAQEDARTLSDRLGTVAVAFAAEDTSSAMGYQLFECGEMMEFAEWGPDVNRFASKKRPLPPWTEFPRDYPDELFRACGLYIPACYARNDHDRPCLVVDGPMAGEVERCDLLELWSSFSSDEPTGCQQLEAEFPEIHVLGGGQEDLGPFGDDSLGEEEIPF
jgi:uncharacterized protein (TIGR02996 family)